MLSFRLGVTGPKIRYALMVDTMLGFAHGGMSFLASKIGVYAYRHQGYSKTTTRDVIAARRSWRDRHRVITQNDDIVCGRSDGGLRSTRTETQTAAKSRMPPNVSSEFTRARLVEPSSRTNVYSRSTPYSMIRENESELG